MKQLNWTKINARKIDGTIWKQIKDEQVQIPVGKLIMSERERVILKNYILRERLLPSINCFSLIFVSTIRRIILCCCY
jgi:hypothetical protein